MSRLTKSVAVLILVLTLGLHWMVLQSVAWLTMIARYAQLYPLSQAISMTFDGQHPCSICIFVSQGQQEERQQSQQQHLTLEKLELFAFQPLAFVFTPAEPDLPQSSDLVPTSRLDEPPSPPPRFA